MPQAILLCLLPPLITEIGQGIREYLRRKEQMNRIEALEHRVAELERWRKS
jgi:hypothetical protein